MTNNISPLVNNMSVIKPVDRLIFRLLFGFLFPVLFFMLAFTIWFYAFQDSNVWYFVLAGLFAGILIDAVYLKKLVNGTFELSAWILASFYIFYNICIYGFFMGFPVFNICMGVIAGYYYGRKIIYKDLPPDQIRYLKKRVPLFTAAVMLLICIATAGMGLSEVNIGQELQSMLGLGFRLTSAMIIALILIGGTTLIVSQYFLTKIMLSLIVKRKSNS
jgi:hypothetical protein